MDFENIENLWYEKLFNFYGLLESVPELGEQEPDSMLRLLPQLSPDGINHIQFYIFVKDANLQPYASDKIQCFHLFQEQCQRSQRQFLVCDDFIKIIRRFEELRHSRPHLEKMLERRYIQLQQYNGSLAEMRRNENFTHSQRSDLDLTSRMERMMLFTNRKSDVSRLSSLLNASNLSKYINSQRRSHSA